MAIIETAGSVLTAAALNLLCPLFAIKASNQTVTASATLVNDNDIAFTFVANQTVHVQARLDYQSNTTTNVGLRAAWATTGTLAASARFCLGANDAAASTPDSMLMQSRPMAAINTNNLYATATVASTSLVAWEELIITTGASGGTLTLQWAEFTGTAATSVTMLQGTFAVARYVS